MAQAKQRAQVDPEPCEECGKPVLRWPDGIRRCIDGVGHVRERELGLRRNEPREQPKGKEK